jgi:hypothetical protein
VEAIYNVLPLLSGGDYGSGGAGPLLQRIHDHHAQHEGR